MNINDGVESVIAVTATAEITLRELRNGGGELFAQRLRERLEEELKLILDISWSRVEISNTRLADLKTSE